MKVLIVEDDPIVAMDFEIQAIDEGCSVVGPAHSVNEALELLESEAPKYAVLDYQLGEETSEPIATALQEKGVEFAFVSGQAKRVEDVTDFDVPVFSKPTSIGQVITLLRRGI